MSKLIDKPSLVVGQFNGLKEPRETEVLDNIHYVQFLLHADLVVFKQLKELFVALAGITFGAEASLSPLVAPVVLVVVLVQLASSKFTLDSCFNIFLFKIRVVVANCIESVFRTVEI